MNKILITIRQFTWELPQTILGLIIILCNKISHVSEYNDSKVHYLVTESFGISLGRYIIIPKNSSTKTLKHEYGHCIQSKYFGIFYLLVIGLPSISFNIISQMIGGDFSDNYYNRYPEKWADELGGVTKRE